MKEVGSAGSKPLFVDTGAFYARFDANAQRHERASAVFDGIGEGTAGYGPIYTSTYVLDELATLITSRENNPTATIALDHVRESATIIIHPDETDFDATCDRFEQYHDHELSFTDHMSGVLADDREVQYVFTFDPDHFRTLGFTAVPDDTDDAWRAAHGALPIVDTTTTASSTVTATTRGADCFLPGPS